MKNIINMVIVTGADEMMTGEEVASRLKDKLAIYPTLNRDINRAIEAVRPSCYSKLRKSKSYWNRIVNNKTI